MANAPKPDEQPMPDKYDELERLAKAATPGPWDNFGSVVCDENCGWIAVTDLNESRPWRALTMDARIAIAEHIAAANPAVVLDLIADLRAKDAEINRLIEALFDADAKLTMRESAK